MNAEAGWLASLLTALVDSACHLTLMGVITKRRPRWRYVRIAVLYYLLMALAYSMLWEKTAFSPVKTVLNLLAFLGMTRYVFGLKGKPMWIGCLKTECALVVLPLLSMALLALPLAPVRDPSTNAERFAVAAVYLLATGILLGVIALGRRLMRAVKRHPMLPCLLRMGAAAGFIVLTLLVRSYLPQLLDLSDPANTGVFSLLIGMAAIACVLSLSFIYQDMRTLLQMRSNETLERKQQNIDELLTSMRGFRHNIGNLLYGMEGAMLTNDPTEAREYYRQLVEKCTLINSENIVAVQNVTVPPLAALLLHKLDTAYQRRIPMYLYVQPRVNVRGISKSDLCEVAGVLLDNALEAAAESPAPYVSLELRSHQNEMELVVRNTFVSFEESLASTKPGHEGVGVHSARQILRQRPAAFLNYHVAGRYVEAQVLIS